MASDTDRINHLEEVHGAGVRRDRHGDKDVEFVTGDELRKRIARLERRGGSAPDMSYATFHDD